MKIKVDNYTINSDKNCNVWITETKINPKTGRTYDARVSGYYTDLKSALEDMIKRKAYGSDTKSLEETVNTISNALDSALKIIDEKEI